ncbi:MAG: hypothetical protein H5U36_01160 [Candidatus Caldatribacterium sp.]|nr:hypothetical protein [Candidatus Caldatribacterium sp.]
MSIARVSLEVEPEVTWSRYPGIEKDHLWVPYEEYTREDAEEIRKKAEKVVETAHAFVTWWFR